MQNHAFTLTLSRGPQSFPVPGGRSALVRGVYPGLTGPAVAIEVGPAAATETRVFCFRLDGEDLPGAGWVYLGLCWQNASNEKAMYVYEQVVSR